MCAKFLFKVPNYKYCTIKSDLNKPFHNLWLLCWKLSLEVGSLSDVSDSLLFVGFVSVVAVYPPLPATTKVTILQMDLETVYDGNELNDPIVDFYMMLVHNKCL